jgi:hypothetical protein
MLTYEEYKQIKLTESFLSKLFGSIVEKFKSLLASLSFGKQVSMKIDIPDSNLNEDIDLKSRLGYLSEFACASTLSSVIKDKGLRLTSRSNPKKLNDEFLAKKKIVQKLGASQSEIDRMVTAGAIIAKQIFEDVIVKDEDLLLLTFDINLTGDSGKGVTKADLILTVTKDSEKVVVDKIVASLKAYKSASINLSNSTFISLIKTLFYDADADISGSTEKFILKFAKDYGSEKDLRQLYDYQNIIGTEMKKGKSKEDARKKAKKTHGDVIEIIAKIFQRYYPKHKKVMNERVLRMLGFDGEDDFYAAIGEAGKQKIISSRKSEELQRMISQLSKNFTLTVKRNGKTNNANILFIAPNGEVITKANAFVDFKKFILKRD